MKHSYLNDDTCFSIDVIDEILEEYFDALLDEGSKILYSIEGTILEEKLFAEFDGFMTMTTEENSESEFDTEEPPFKKITFNTNCKIKTSLEEPHTDLELLHPRIHQKHWTDPGDGGSVGRTSCSPGTDLNFKRFETYVKAKDLDLWHIILNGDFPPVARNKETQVLETVPFEQQDDDLKKKLAKNNKAKMVLYNALPKKEYDRIFMCKTVKDIWQSLLITHQGNSQVKDNKINLLVQQYEQFTILEEESIDSGFARFNTIITSLKALDEGFSSKNYVRKFLRALHPKWRAKVTAIEESKDLSSLALDELIDNLKVHEVVMEKDSKIYRGKKERVNENDAEDKTNDETCLMAQSSNEVTLNSSHYSDDASSLDNDSMQIEYDSLCEISLKIINKNKILKTKRDLLEKEILELNEKIKKLKRSKEVEIACARSTYLESRVLTYGEKGTEHVFSLPMSSRSDFVITRKKLIQNSIDQSKKSYLEPSPKSDIVEESLNVTFDEIPPPTKLSPLLDDDVGEEEAIKRNTKVVNNNNEEDESIEVDKIVNIKESKNHPLDQVIEILNQRTLRSQAQNHSNFFCFISTIEPKDVKEALKDKSWVAAISTGQNLCDDFAKIMHDEFEMSMMRELNFFLGLQIKQMEDGIFFNQSKYIKEMLKKFGLEDSKPTKTPMSTEIKLTKDDEADSIDSSKYRENPKTTHLEAVKRIFRYIRGTSHLELWYPKGTKIETIVYADSDHVGDYVDRKSTSGVCTFMGCCLTSWFAKKQTALAISTTEAEYVSARKACQQAL
ncbi:retrovirus-related pol polyprotein from transposon TNT 1-94 [Tanacetum coccineum]